MDRYWNVTVHTRLAVSEKVTSMPFVPVQSPPQVAVVKPMLGEARRRSWVLGG